MGLRLTNLSICLSNVFYFVTAKKETKIWLFLFLFHPGWIRLIWKSVITEEDGNSRRVNTFLTYLDASVPQSISSRGASSTRAVGAPGAGEHREPEAHKPLGRRSRLEGSATVCLDRCQKSAASCWRKQAEDLPIVCFPHFKTRSSSAPQLGTEEAELEGCRWRKLTVSVLFIYLGLKPWSWKYYLS